MGGKECCSTTFSSFMCSDTLICQYQRSGQLGGFSWFQVVFKSKLLPWEDKAHFWKWYKNLKIELTEKGFAVPREVLIDCLPWKPSGRLKKRTPPPPPLFPENWHFSLQGKFLTRPHRENWKTRCRNLFSCISRLPGTKRGMHPSKCWGQQEWCHACLVSPALQPDTWGWDCDLCNRWGNSYSPFWATGI